MKNNSSSYSITLENARRYILKNSKNTDRILSKLSRKNTIGLQFSWSPRQEMFYRLSMAVIQQEINASMGGTLYGNINENVPGFQPQYKYYRGKLVDVNFKENHKSKVVCI